MTTPPKTPPWPELTTILLARQGVLWLLILVSFLLPNDDALLYALMGIAFIITVPYSLWLRSRLHTMQFAPLQFIVDLILVTGVIYYTGGLKSPFTLLYPLMILSAAIAGTAKQAMVMTALAMVVYSMTASILFNGISVEHVQAQTLSVMDSIWFPVLTRSLFFAFFGGAGIYIARRCNVITSHDLSLKETTFELLENIPAPLLLLNTEGWIVYANDPACAALNTTDETLCTKKFSDLCCKDSNPIPESFGRSAHLTRESNAPLPVSYTTRDMQIQETALLGSAGRKNTGITITLLLFVDITNALKTARQLQKVERITRATRIAGEMAHEIQAPLATLSASIELLRHYEDNATAADWLPSSTRRNDRRELFEHIEDASSRMDSVIRHFIDFAEFSPQDLISIIKLDSTAENLGYMDHLNTTAKGLKDGQNSNSG
ncbi:MAG TPA: histidine kinase dimerization/phospho-acceptor domain-containing protein [Pontiella sp.]|nr:histidine kinase dimerization/phospho-acceptor domain-containing protein [Pontiella sp.]